jgi:hypothetical protein
MVGGCKGMNVSLGELRGPPRNTASGSERDERKRYADRGERASERGAAGRRKKGVRDVLRCTPPIET